MKTLVLTFTALSLAMSAALADTPTTSSLKEIARIRISGKARWDYLTVDSARHRLYVSHSSRTEVIDTQTNQLVGTIEDTPGVHGIALAPELGLGFISDGKADTVTVFELSTLKTVSTLPVGGNPDAILYDPGSGRVMTFNGGSKDVTLIDAAHGQVVATVPLGGKPEFAQLGKGGAVWFNLEDSNELAVLDPKTGRLLARHSLAPCESPSGLAVDGHDRLFSVCDNRQMVVTSPEGQVLSRPAIGNGPDGVAWLDGAAYSANGEDGTLSVVRETTPGHFDVVETIPTVPGARTIAADPATHRLYLPAADLLPAKPGQRRVGVTGSFFVLVLENRH